MNSQIEEDRQSDPHLLGPTFASRRQSQALSGSKRPAFVFVLPWEPHHIGGVSAVVKNLARVLGERGSMTPIVVADLWSASTPRRAADSWSFRFALLGSTSVSGLLKALVTAPMALGRTWRMLHDMNASVVNFHYPGQAPLGVALLKRLRLFRGKLVLSFHGTDVAPPRSRVERQVQRFILQSADRLVACSRSLAARMASDLSIPPERIDVVYNGVDEALYDGTRGRHTLQGLPAAYIVNIGSFIARKNHRLLLQAFVLLAPSRSELHLCIAGADGAERVAVEETVRALGLQERVHIFVGLAEQQVAELLAGAKACVQTSLAESFPLALLEAGASGTPLVVSDIPGHDELVCHDVNGLRFVSGDAAACAGAVARVLDEPSLATRLAAEQRSQVRGKLTWSASVAQYERLLAQAD